MSKKCRGSCFEQLVNMKYVKKSGSKCRCKLKSCPKCGCKRPQIILDCCEGYCANCGCDIYHLYLYINKKLNIDTSKNKGNLQKFADLMTEYIDYCF